MSGISGSKKVSIGKSGVEFRFYKKAEYDKLNKAQKDELREYRANKGGGDKPSKAPRTDQKQMISAAVAEHLAEHKKQEAEAEQAETSIKDYILSVVNKKPAKGTITGVASAAAAQPTPPITLQSILKRVKHT